MLNGLLERKHSCHVCAGKKGVPFDWKVQTSTWNVEDTGQWKTEDTDKFFYGIEEKKTTSELLKEGFEEEQND
jgi:hypothetical protein